MRLIQSIYRFDVSLFMWISSCNTQAGWVRLARWVSASANGPLYLLLMLVLYLGRSELADLLLSCLLLGFLIERPIYFILKPIFRRDRPFENLKTRRHIVPGDRFSFPSGHTSAAFLVATMLGSFEPILYPGLLLWASSVAAARVILGVHFPTDTLVGALMGSGLAMAAMEILIQ